MKKIDAILMASGFSSRFGENNKLLTTYKGKPLAKYTIELVCSLDFNRVIFVTAHNDVSLLAEGLDVLQIKNENPKKGQRESVRLGVQASDADFYMLFPCDQPLLDTYTVETIAHRATDGNIIYPVYKDMPGNPCLFAKKYRRELLELEPGQYPRIVRQRHRESCVEIQVYSKELLFDVDTLADMERLLNL